MQRADQLEQQVVVTAVISETVYSRLKVGPSARFLLHVAGGSWSDK
jgi:hypothetical protein